MDETNQVQPEEKLLDERLCVNCQERRFEGEYKTKLCYDCRQAFINYPIPKWIWAFGGGILVIMLIGMFRMPLYFSSAIHLSRAEKAMDEKLYQTAQNELKQVVEAFPDNTEANAKLFIASGRNLDMLLFSKTYDNIIGKNFEDQTLLKEVEGVMAFVQSIYPKDTMLNIKVDMVKDSSAFLLTLFDTYKNNEDYLVAGVAVSNCLYDLKDYEATEKVLEEVLKVQNNFYPALSLLAATKRNLKKFDEAIAVCDKMMEENKEDINALSQKTRIEIKRKNDKQASFYATQAVKINPESIVAMEAQAMVNYFTGKKAESINLLTAIQQKEKATGDDSTISSRLRLVINGTTNYR